MKEHVIGLFNANYDNDCRLRLNLSEVPNFSLFEGEIIVAEGFMDTKKFNVNRLYKPESYAVNQPQFTKHELLNFNKKSCGKAMSYMVVCGPFTANNELSYEALKDVIAQVQRDQPHCLILTGPFVSQNHEDIQSGDLRYRLPDGTMKFLDYQGLFNKVIEYIDEKIPKQTQMVIVPSTNEIQHTYPLPQPPLSESMFSHKLAHKPLLVSNPCLFRLNDVTIGVINTDIIKDMCLNTCIKNPVT